MASEKTEVAEENAGVDIGMEPQLVQYIKFATKRCFGIELEVDKSVSINKLSDAVRHADPKRQVQSSEYYQRDYGNDYWHVKFDRSCGSKAKEGGWEIASFKASGAQELTSISEMGDVLKKIGAKVNDNCGYHIHCEISDFKHEHAATLVANWMKLEQLILEILPKNRRNNIYCKLLREHRPIKPAHLKDHGIFWQYVRPVNETDPERRVALNMGNYAIGTPAKRTAELRLPEGTLDSKDIKNWARLFIHFVNFNKKTAFPGNVESVTNLHEALRILGLHNEEPFFILSKGLYETKTWFLQRILKYSTNKSLKKEAQEFLDFIIPPSEKKIVVPIPKIIKHKVKIQERNTNNQLMEDDYWAPYGEA